MTIASADRELTRFAAETVLERSLDAFAPRPDDAWSVARAHSALEALIVSTGGVSTADLVLVDSRMGDLLDLLERLKLEAERMPLVAVLTERGRDLTLRRRLVRRHEVAGFIERPFDASALASLLERLDRRRRVLLVGPEGDDSLSRVEVLTDAGHHVEHKRSAEDAWAGLDAYRPDLLVGALSLGSAPLCVRCKSTEKWSKLPALLYGRFDELPARPLSENVHRADDFISTEESLERFAVRVAALVGAGRVLRPDRGASEGLRPAPHITSTMPKAAFTEPPSFVPSPPRPSPTRRLTRRVPITVTVDLLDEERTVRSETLDVSEGGIFVALEEPPPVGAEVDIAFNLPGHGEVKAKAKVAWQSGAGMGLRFKTIDGQDLEAVVDYVNRLARILYTSS